jgi:hypothetical protein
VKFIAKEFAQMDLTIPFQAENKHSKAHGKSMRELYSKHQVLDLHWLWIYHRFRE